jgi:hypothetical protein
MLQELARTAATTPLTRQRLAVANAVLGHRETAALCSLVTGCPSSDVNNLILGLKSLPVESVLEDLEHRYRSENSGIGRTRLSITLLELGDPRAAQEELSLKENPTDRVRFIYEFPTWPGDLGGPLERLKTTQDSAFRSGLILALGGISPELLPSASRTTLVRLCSGLFLSALDGGTHGAAGWCLRRHHIPLPDVPQTRGPVGGS